MVVLINLRLSRTISLLIFVWILCGVLPVFTQAAIKYEVIDLGTLGGSESMAISINDNYQIVGWAEDIEGNERATLFDPTGAGNNIDLGTLGGAESHARSINDLGQIVGHAMDSQDHEHATLFDPNGTGNNIDLGTLGGNSSSAHYINNISQIVGSSEDTEGYRRATLFDTIDASNNIDLGTLGGDESWASSVNDTGQIVGSAQNSQGDHNAILFDITGMGNNIDLGTWWDGPSSAASINNIGQVAGRIASYGYDWQYAVLFDITGADKNIRLDESGDFPFRVYYESFALSINEVGQVVGGAVKRSLIWTGHAVLFDSTGAGNNIDLIDKSSGWSWTMARDINNSGWIVGDGQNAEGKSHAFLLIPRKYEYSGGTGEPNEPYQIATIEDLIALGETPEDYHKHFILTTDINLYPNPNTPIRKVFDRAVIAPDVNDTEDGFQGTSFAGFFNGNGHTISHLMIAGESYLGLFGKLEDGANISNVGLEDVDVHGKGWDVGGLVGCNYGNINMSYSTGSVIGNNDVGGLVGRNGGSIVASYSTGTVNGNHDVGGLVGGIYAGSITSSYSTSKVSGNENVGGLVGWSNRGSITSSFWDTETSGQTDSRWGLGIGLPTSEMQDINTFLDAGWDFVDEVTNGTANLWQNQDGKYPQLAVFSGLIPVESQGSGTREDPYLISDANELGSIWYRPQAHYLLSRSIDLVGITWNTSVIPWFSGSFDGNNHVIDHLNIEGGGNLGLIGIQSSIANISNLGLETVDVNGTGNTVGMLLGRNLGYITSCYSTGKVSGGYYEVGGLVGLNGGSIVASYSNGEVSGHYFVGGLVGSNSDGSINSSYCTSTVSGDYVYKGHYVTVGGLVGGIIGGSITSSFWDTETSGKSVSAGGIGKTTSEMQTATTFLEAGWDFMDESDNGTDDIWWIDEGNDYPRLWWELISEN
jgi:probable HAF family extracellular repeat protein